MTPRKLPWEDLDEEFDVDEALIAELMQERPDGNDKTPNHGQRRLMKEQARRMETGRGE